jgi:hypothetical protein
MIGQEAGIAKNAKGRMMDRGKNQKFPTLAS